MNDIIQQKINRLTALRSKCKFQGREPNIKERRIANKWLDEIEKYNFAENIEEKSKGFPVNDVPSSLPEYREGKKTMTTQSGEFRNFGELLADVAVAGKNGIISGRLQRAATGLSESVPSDGGFLVSPTYSNDLLETAWESTQVANRCWKVNIGSGSNSLKIPGFDETSRATGSRFGGVQGYWLAEAAEKTASKPKFRQIELNLNKLIGLCYASDEVIQDAGLLEQAIKRAFVSEIAFQLDNAVINGSGAGQPLGILNAGCTVSVSKEAGQTADTIVFENVLKMWSRLLPRSQRQAVWLVNQNAMPQIYQMSLAIGTAGAPVFLAAAGQASSSPYSTLFGRPIIPIEQCPTLGDSGDIILTDLKSGYILAQKAGGIQQDVSIHLRFVYDESCYRFVLRVDGQPTLASTITPFAGTDTLSHHVVLNERA